MKILVLLLSFLVWLPSFSQEWQTLSAQYYTGTDRFCTGPNFNKHFKISPYDNSIWMTKVWAAPYYIRTIDSEGVFKEFSHLNVPLFESYSVFYDIEFTTDRTMVYSPISGLFSYNGTTWIQEATVTSGMSISSDVDTIWLSREPFDGYFKWAAGSMFTGTQNTKRIRSKSGNMWISSGQWDIIGKFVEGVGPTYHSPDTSVLLSWANHDFKFPHNSDTLYVAGDLGFSLAYNGHFVDTLSPYNTVNMPGSLIIEFEFDPQDNIWAVFGTGTTVNDSTTSIGYYDRSLNEWTMVYDGSNSPIPFDDWWITIEVDSSGNLWATDGRDIHVLKINNWPGWLDVHEAETQTFGVFPNPSMDEIRIELPEDAQADEIIITDLSGKVVHKSYYTSTLNIERLTTGIYLINLLNEGRVLTSRKLVKQ